MVSRGIKGKTNFLDEKGEEIKDKYESIRPNAEQYEQSFAEFNQEWQGMDRKEFMSRMSEEEKKKFRESFENIGDIKDEKIEIIDMKMENPEKRFHIQKERIQDLSKRDIIILSVVFAGLSAFLV